MRGTFERQATMLSIVSPEQRVPKDHPIRKIKAMADRELARLCPVFDVMYSTTGRPSIPPERILKSKLLIALYSVRGERQFCEELDYNLLYRWFLDMNMLEDSFDHSVFAKNSDRLMEHEVGHVFFDSVVGLARESGLMSDDHFTVDGTLIEAYASLKSFRPKDETAGKRPADRADACLCVAGRQDDPGNPTIDFHGEKRSNDTHQSTTDPESLLMRKSKGKEAKLSYGAHALMENRNGLLVDIQVTPATGTCERESADEMLNRQGKKGLKPKTLGADKGYDTKDFVSKIRSKNITPHVSANTKRKGGSAIDGRTTRHHGYAISQRIRKRVEEIFGWMKTVGGFRKTRYKGRDKTQLQAWFVGAAYNLIRMAKLMPIAAAV